MQGSVNHPGGLRSYSSCVKTRRSFPGFPHFPEMSRPGRPPAFSRLQSGTGVRRLATHSERACFSYFAHDTIGPRQFSDHVVSVRGPAGSSSPGRRISMAGAVSPRSNHAEWFRRASQAATGQFPMTGRLLTGRQCSDGPEPTAARRRGRPEGCRSLGDRTILALRAHRSQCA